MLINSRNRRCKKVQTLHAIHDFISYYTCDIQRLINVCMVTAHRKLIICFAAATLDSLADEYEVP